MARYESPMEIFQRTDFGNPDALYDINLESYFLDQNYWREIIESEKFYVIGRKGTGKSAIYKWLYSQQINKESIIENLSFNSFPFEKLLKLSDDDFTRPNQYQSIWKYIILTELCKLIKIDQRDREMSDSLLEILQYIDFRFGNNLQDLHSTITSKVNKTTSGLKFQGLGISSSSDKSNSFILSESDNITEINKRLQLLIFEYLNHSNLSYYLQFDQLDDNYTLYVKNRKYFEAIISLFKVIYDLNNSLKSVTNKCKVIAYLRSDIYKNFPSVDADSAKFNYHTFKIVWHVKELLVDNNSRLKEMINLRIKNSTKTGYYDPFQILFKSENINLRGAGDRLLDPFSYILNRSLYRPRDIVQFCIQIQEAIARIGVLNYKTIINAERFYSQWLLDELANEISPLLSAPAKNLYSFLRKLGTQQFSLDDFRSLFIYEHLDEKFSNTSRELLKNLYELGIVSNVFCGKDRIQFFSVITDENSEIDYSLYFVLHLGIRKGLNIYNNH
jgi:hypothetical protein